MSTPRIPLPFTTVFTASDVESAGFTKGALVGWRLRGEVQEVCRGVYAPSGLKVDDRVRSVHRSHAATTGVTPLSAVGAAQIHGLWLPPGITPAQRTTNPKRPVPADCLTTHGRLVLPTLEWTALQLARWQPLEGALIPLDSALRNGASNDALRELAGRMQRWPGTAGLGEALAACSALSGSPLESYSRGLMIRRGIPDPTLQQRFVVHGRRYYADFAWPDVGVIGEADGAGKYAEESAIHDEKRRQGALQSLGLVVLRWGWHEVRREPEAWLRGLRSALR